MPIYPEDVYYSRSKGGFNSYPVSLHNSRDANFSSNSLTSPRYVNRLQSGYSSASLTNHRPGGILWRQDRLSGSVTSPNLLRDSHNVTYQSLPSGFKVNSRAYHPQHIPVYVTNIPGSAYEGRRTTGARIGLSSKSRSQHDLSSTLSQVQFYDSDRHNRYDDEDDIDDYGVEIDTRRWNEDSARGRQRNGTLITGPCAGLYNLGNTNFIIPDVFRATYIISLVKLLGISIILQCLANTQPLITYFLSKSYKKDFSGGRFSLVSAFAEVMYTLWNTRRAFAPDNFRYEIGLSAKAFAGFSQHDAQEFLSYLLQRLSEDLNRVTEKSAANYSRNMDEMSDSEKSERLWEDYLKSENSIVTDLFMGQLRSQLRCCECGSASNTFDPCIGLSLPIKKSYGFQDTTLLDCFELYSQEERLDGQERTLCENCKKRQKSNKRLSIEKFPKILIIHLKRFSKGRFGHSKLTAKVQCPLTLDLSQFSSSRKDIRSIVYDLFAVCNHTGTVSSGHYTAAAKSHRTGQWCLYDDERVRLIPDPRPVASDEAYILLYELRSVQRSEL